MIPVGLQPNNITYNSMLYHYCRVGNIKKAANIVQTMASNGCEPDVVTYCVLIHGLCNVGRIEIAIRLLITIQMKGMALAPQTYNPLLRELFKRKKTKAAMRLFREMKEKGDPPDAFSYETVFRGLCSGGGPIGEAVDFVVEMTEKRLILEFSTFCMLAERLCALSVEDTLVMLIERIMDMYFFSENEVSMIKGFMKKSLSLKMHWLLLAGF
ncbi:pentatricopeptide repeat-containing protein At3g53700, chloroplastic-like [Rhododendron vialii]|uniref:pentatricopeptide repeat-containing protein At3g53700, chloroplastic-like n=1 Tax=Rhododendron vialii TaxID=182163 RepID=UPI00265DFCB6|nr:pentatricopeptide repeat-containing protein At3g53700, chloroplastic-like [Rhododendron vialii]